MHTWFYVQRDRKILDGLHICRYVSLHHSLLFYSNWAEMNFVDKEEQTGGTVDWPQNIQTTNLNCYIKSRIYIINGQSTVLPLLSFLFELRYVIFWKSYIFYVIHSYISKTIVIFVSNLEGEEKAFHDYVLRIKWSEVWEKVLFFTLRVLNYIHLFSLHRTLSHSYEVLALN